jgi:predicted amino acid dehydrogenase
MNDKVTFSTDERNKIDYDGALDFAFIVHARHVDDIIRTYPHLHGHSKSDIVREFDRHHVHVGSWITATHGGRTLRGELIGVPLNHGHIRHQLRRVRESLHFALEYCSWRQTRVVGLGALLPSLTDYGRSLIEHANGIGITTGHSFTAYAIAEHVRAIESLLGAPQSVAIVGAAGSTGRACIHVLLADPVHRSLTFVDLPNRLRGLAEIIPGSRSKIAVTSDLSAICRSSVVVCVTNSSKAILRPECLAPNCIIIDDAQPENISFAMAQQRPDVIVIKCLARVPGLKCPFDFGLFSHMPTNAEQEIVFTCLAETVTLAASGHCGHFTIGSPTPAQITGIAEMASRVGVTIAPFHSFPEIGEVQSHRAFRKLTWRPVAGL